LTVVALLWVRFRSAVEKFGFRHRQIFKALFDNMVPIEGTERTR
jgi:hypothetical protein